MIGRPRKPTALKLVTGNPGNRPLNAKEPKSAILPPDYPPPEGLPDAAKTEWATFVKLTSNMRVLTVNDLSALEQMARMKVLLRALYDDIEANGYTYTTIDKMGNTIYRRRPETQVYSDMDRRYRNYLHEFGLTPASRSRVNAEGPSGEDKEEFF